MQTVSPRHSWRPCVLGVSRSKLRFENCQRSSGEICGRFPNGKMGGWFRNTPVRSAWLNGWDTIPKRMVGGRVRVSSARRMLVFLRRCSMEKCAGTNCFGRRAPCWTFVAGRLSYVFQWFRCIRGFKKRFQRILGRSANISGGHVLTGI